MPRIVRFLIISAVLAALLLIPGSVVPRQYPTVIAGLGDSITQAANTCCGSGSYPARSWSTGDLPADGIDSHYERLAALHPQVSGNNHNYSVNGARAAGLAAQASAAVAQEADYVTILIGANDLCASSPSVMTSTADFARQIEAALDTLHRGLPRARIHVSSIPDLYHLWSVLRSNREARQTWSGSGICPSMLGAGTSEAQRREVVARQEAFNAILADTCTRYRNCRWDDGAVYRYRFSPGQISTLDYFHPSPAGQSALAELTWQAFNGPRSFGDVPHKTAGSPAESIPLPGRPTSCSLRLTGRFLRFQRRGRGE